MKQEPHEPDPPTEQIPSCEILINRMFRITGLPLIRHTWRLVRWGIPCIINCCMVGAWFCPFYYPEYYPTQDFVWTGDLVLITFVYDYLFHLQKQWEKASCFEHTQVPTTVHRISITFYWLYLLYWLYFAVIQFSDHQQPGLKQAGNVLMSTAWWIFFSTAALIYYYICIKLSQRAEGLRAWLKSLRANRPPIETFYIQYTEHYRRAKMIARYWNLIIFTGFLLLTFHVPIDLISIVYRKYYYDIFGLIVKCCSLLWYIIRICDLNEYENELIAHLYKHRLYTMEQMNEIVKFTQYRPLGLNFYGIKINYAFVVKLTLLLFNLFIPTLYALVNVNMFYR